MAPKDDKEVEMKLRKDIIDEVKSTTSVENLKKIEASVNKIVRSDSQPKTEKPKKR